MTRRMGSLAAMVFVLVLAGCSSSTASDGGATPDPTIAFCDALDDYGAALAKFEALTPSATVDDYKAAGTAAKASLAVLVAAAAPFAGAQVFELRRAQDVLNGAVEQLPAAATPAMAEVALDPLIKDVIVQVVAQHNAMCNTRSSPSSAP